MIFPTHNAIAINANSFVSTFAFFADTQARQINAKELTSKRTGQRRTGADLTRHSYEKTEGYAANSTLPKVAVQCFVGQFCGYINFSASMKVCAVNRHLRQAAKC